MFMIKSEAVNLLGGAVHQCRKHTDQCNFVVTIRGLGKGGLTHGWCG